MISIVKKIKQKNKKKSEASGDVCEEDGWRRARRGAASR